jgi:hypothetical protein
MNDVELIKVNKFADNDFRAAAIATGCKLWELKTEGEKIARVRLYRDWRVSKIYGKDTKSCFEMACKGEAVPVVNMFDVPFTDDSPVSEAEDKARMEAGG